MFIYIIHACLCIYTLYYVYTYLYLVLYYRLVNFYILNFIFFIFVRFCFLHFYYTCIYTCIYIIIINSIHIIDIFFFLCVFHISGDVDLLCFMQIFIFFGRNFLKLFQEKMTAFLRSHLSREEMTLLGSFSQEKQNTLHLLCSIS